MPKSTKTFTKKAREIFGELPAKFTRPIIAPGANFVKVSDDAAKALQSVNMTVFRGHLIYPTHPKNKVKVRETKRGVFITDINDFGTKSEIILAKNGKHLQYGQQLAKRHPKGHSYGTLKETTYDTKQGTVHGWLRDTAVTHEDYRKAMIDNRYEHDKSKSGTNTAVTALIRVTY